MRKHRAWIVPFALAAIGWAAANTLCASSLSIVDTLCDVDFPSCTDGIQGLRGAQTVAISPDGKHLYVPTALDDALIVLSRGPDGSMSFEQSLFDTDAGIDGLDSARGAAVSADGENVYVVALLDSSVTVFSRNSATGLLTYVETHFDDVGGVDGLAGAHSVALSPDDLHVYVASRSEDAVAVFEREAGNGTLTFLEAHFDNLAGVDGLDAAEAIVVSPDGEHVYVAAETDNAVAVFSRETDSGSADFGKLTFVEAIFEGVAGVDGLEGANGIAVDPTGSNVYVASERGSGGGDWGAVFGRNPGTGSLTFVQGFQEDSFGIDYFLCTGVGPDNSGVAVSPDGLLVYLTNPFRGTVAVFDRAPATGSLSLAFSICDENFGLDGIAGAISVTPSPDGRFVYTASPSFETLAALAHPIFVDGFESGDTSAWTTTVP